MGKQKQIDLRKNQIDVFRNKKYKLLNKNSTGTVTQWMVKQLLDTVEERISESGDRSEKIPIMQYCDWIVFISKV